MRTILFLLLLITCNNAFACKCRELTAKEAVNAADGVVVGKILTKQKYVVLDSAGTHSFSFDTTAEFQGGRGIVSTGFVYELQVDRVYKGRLNKGTIKIYTGLGQGDCGVVFEPGGKYIVFGSVMDVKASEGYPEGPRLSTNICMGTKGYSRAKAREVRRAAR